MQQTIEKLRKSGFKVRVLHRRYKAPVFINEKPALYARVSFGGIGGLDINSLMAKGGETRVELRTPSGEEVVGVASCSLKDTFNRKEGNRIALERALKQVKTPVEVAS